MNNDRLSFASQCDSIIASYQEDFAPKANLLKHCVTLAEDALKNAGLDLSKFAMAVDTEVFFGRLLQDILEEGLLFDVLCTEMDEDGVRYAATIHIMQSEGNQLGISAVTTRYTMLPAGDGAEEIKETLMNSEWTVYFAYEEGEAEPRDCRECENCETCEKYLHQQDLADLLKEFRRFKEIADKITPAQQKIMLEDTGEAYLLNTFAEEGITFTDAEWKETKEKYGLLLELYENLPDMFAFEYVFKEPVLVHADISHSGFLIRQNGDKLELCALLDDDFYVDAMLDEDEWFKGFEDGYIPELQALRLSVAAGDVKDMEKFAKRFLNKYSGGNTVYTIPLSLNRVVNLSGTIGKNIGKTVNIVQKVAGKGTPMEQGMAAVWCKYFRNACKALRPYIIMD